MLGLASLYKRDGFCNVFPGMHSEASFFLLHGELDGRHGVASLGLLIHK